MAQILRSGEGIDEWHLRVTGGVAIVLDRAEEVDGLLSVCSFAVAPPSSPLDNVFNALNSGILNLDQWADHFRDVNDFERRADRRLDNPWSQESFGERRTVLATLIDALTLARALWEAEPDDAAALLRLIVVLADPQVPANGAVLDGDAAGLALQYGSLSEMLIKLPLHCLVFAVCFVLGGGVTPTARTKDHVDRLRGAASQAGPNILLRIDQIDSAKVAGKKRSCSSTVC